MGQNNSSFKPEHIKALNAFDPRVEHLKKELITLVERHHSHQGPSREEALRKCAICADALAAFHQHVSLFHTELRYYTLKTAERHGRHLTEAEMLHAEQLSEHANIVLSQIKHLIESEMEHELLPSSHHHHHDNSAQVKSGQLTSHHNSQEAHHPSQVRPASHIPSEPHSPAGQSETGDVFDPEDVFPSADQQTGSHHPNRPSVFPPPNRETSEVDCYIPGSDEVPANDLASDDMMNGGDMVDGNATPLDEAQVRKSNRTTFAVTSIDADEGSTFLPDMHSRNSSMASDSIPAKPTGHRITQSFADTAPASISVDPSELENRLSRVSSNGHMSRHAPQPSYVDPEMNDAAMQTSINPDKLSDRLSRVSVGSLAGMHHSRGLGSMASVMEPIGEDGDSTPRADQRHSTMGTMGEHKVDSHKGPAGSRHSNPIEVQDDENTPQLLDTWHASGKSHRPSAQPQEHGLSVSSHASVGSVLHDSRGNTTMSTGTQHSMDALNKMAEVEDHIPSSKASHRSSAFVNGQLREDSEAPSEVMGRDAQESLMTERGSYSTLNSLPDLEDKALEDDDDEAGQTFHAAGIRDSVLTAKCHNDHLQSSTMSSNPMDRHKGYTQSDSSESDRRSSTISQDGSDEEDEEDDEDEEEEEEEEEPNVIQVDLGDLARQFAKGNRKQRMETDGSRFTTLDSGSSSSGSGSFDSDKEAHHLSTHASAIPHEQARRAIEDQHRSKHLSKVDIERGAFLGENEQKSPDAVRSLTALYPKPAEAPHKMPSQPVWKS